MSDLTNTITVDGAVWVGTPPTANVLSDDGAQWSVSASGDAMAAGQLAFVGNATGLAVAMPGAGTAQGLLVLSGIAQGIMGGIVMSSRRVAPPATSANSGRLVRQQ
ncbi:MAG: hypothetical protein DI533_09695 [Cereibacter sphaeroides]|uniref:Uncharacterized protein n=1 Tax=Cereibacter sphaeroides TaxID=1063 RepID=A0A2W5SCJ2_CERSP|nr:MAG: hypothetical protein DI533_09695 [Cereibacter sphaeroides]